MSDELKKGILKEAEKLLKAFYETYRKGHAVYEASRQLINTASAKYPRPVGHTDYALILARLQDEYPQIVALMKTALEEEGKMREHCDAIDRLATGLTS